MAQFMIVRIPALLSVAALSLTAEFLPLLPLLPAAVDAVKIRSNQDVNITPSNRENVVVTGNSGSSLSGHIPQTRTVTTGTQTRTVAKSGNGYRSWFCFDNKGGVMNNKRALGFWCGIGLVVLVLLICLCCCLFSEGDADDGMYNTGLNLNELQAHDSNVTADVTGAAESGAEGSPTLDPLTFQLECERAVERQRAGGAGRWAHLRAEGVEQQGAGGAGRWAHLRAEGAAEDHDSPLAAALLRAEEFQAEHDSKLAAALERAEAFQAEHTRLPEGRLPHGVRPITTDDGVTYYVHVSGTATSPANH